MTGGVIFQELFNNGTLGDVPTHYGLNIINQKITFPRDNNFSDDELAFLPYFVYFYSLKVLRAQPLLGKCASPLYSACSKGAGGQGEGCLQHTVGRHAYGKHRSDVEVCEVGEKFSVGCNLQLRNRYVILCACINASMYGDQYVIHNIITGAKDPSLIEDLVWNLRTWPLELIEWGTQNSHRLDITFNPEQDRYLSYLCGQWLNVCCCVVMMCAYDHTNKCVFSVGIFRPTLNLSVCFQLMKEHNCDGMGIHFSWILMLPVQRQIQGHG